MHLIFEILWICWLVSEILLNRLLLAKNNSSENPDKYSLLIIWITIGISIFLGVYFSFRTKALILDNNLFLYAGSALLLLGMIIRFIAIRTLGKFFTVNLNISTKHKVVQHGLYKYLRHPSYSGSLLSFFGFGLSINNWISLIIIFIPVTMAMLYRIKLEENLLLKSLGKEYEEYTKNTWRLIPYIF